MLCYRDRTFCPHCLTCTKGETCCAALTPNIEQAAKASGIPVATWLERPKCFKEKDGDTTRRKENRQRHTQPHCATDKPRVLERSRSPHRGRGCRYGSEDSPQDER